MQGAKSSIKNFDLGTPQGSCISPFMFNIIMNRFISNKTDLNQLPYKAYPHQVKLINYTDDIAMVSYEARNIDKHVQKALSALDDNCCLLGLKISVDKTKIMSFLIGKDPPNATPFMLQGTPLEQVPTYKYLVVHFDRFLHFGNHITYTNGRLRKKLNLLKSLVGLTWGANT